MNVHPGHLEKLFKAYSGMKMSGYINELRIRDACVQLKETDTSVIDIACAFIFESLRTFNRAFTRFMGASQKAYREKAQKKIKAQYHVAYCNK